MSTKRMCRQLPADEQGIALVMAMLVLTVLAIALSSLIYFTSTNQRTSSYAKSTQVATSLAEAGINNAVAILSNPDNSNYLLQGDLLPPRTSTDNGGTVTWQGTIDTQMVWHLTSTATVANPTGPNAAPIRKTMTAKVQVRTPVPKKLDLKVWNWIYSPRKGSGGCDTQFDQKVTILAPFWVGGNLCLNNNASVQAPLYVGGYVNLMNPGASIGNSGSPVSEAYVGNGCQWQTQPYYNPCVVNGTIVGGKAAKTNVWVAGSPWNPLSLPTDFQDVSAPTICWGPGSCTGDPVGGWYSAASPGPLHPCEVSSGPVPLFDNNGTLDPNGSVPGQFNLTPDNVSYTCKTVNGELSWNYLTRTLTVVGAIYIDGSVTAQTSGSQPITYTGDRPCTSDGACQAALFVSGTFSLTSEHLCAVVNGNDCYKGGWDPNKKLLIILAHGHGGFLAPNDGIEVTTSQTSFQGGLYADWNILAGQGAWTEGPLVSGMQTIIVGQNNDVTIPQLRIGPLGIQGPPGKFWIEAPYDFTG